MSPPIDSSPLDMEAAHRRYEEERNKRLRADGNAQYIEPTGKLAHYLDDPHTKPTERAAIEEEIDVAVVGSGFGGLMIGGRLRALGLKKIRLIDSAGGVGGTWYWNRYPGAQCDIESYIYLPLLEETGYMPKEKYARGPEIREHSQRVADHFGLTQDILFHTELTEARWDEDSSRWLLRTDRGDRLAARYVCVSMGPLPRLKLPGVPGIETFQGHSFHSSRWDYGYTGGSDDGGMTKLADKRVGVIGTGCTGLQVIPHLARDAKELVVFQRTPSTVDARGNGPTDPEWAESLAPGWQLERMENFNNLTWYRREDEDMVGDGWTDLYHRTMARIMAEEDSGKLTSEDIDRHRAAANFEKMEALWARIDDLVDDPATAESLKPRYRFFCKRPAFHDEYLQSFNRENVTLVDTQGAGVERITERGVVAQGKEYELDCLIYATGFEVGTAFTRRANFEAIGRNGKTLSEHWGTGMRTFQSHMTDGFPNFFILMSQQGAQPYNYTHMLDVMARHVKYIVERVQKAGAKSIEPSSEAVDAWVKMIVDAAPHFVALQDGCTPGYYNNEGQIEDFDVSQLFYADGPHKIFKILDQWRDGDKLEGMELA